MAGVIRSGTLTPTIENIIRQRVGREPGHQAYASNNGAERLRHANWSSDRYLRYA